RLLLRAGGDHALTACRRGEGARGGGRAGRRGGRRRRRRGGGRGGRRAVGVGRGGLAASTCDHGEDGSEKERRSRDEGTEAGAQGGECTVTFCTVREESRGFAAIAVGPLVARSSGPCALLSPSVLRSRPCSSRSSRAAPPPPRPTTAPIPRPPSTRR